MSNKINEGCSVGPEFSYGTEEVWVEGQAGFEVARYEYHCIGESTEVSQIAETKKRGEN